MTGANGGNCDDQGLLRYLQKEIECDCEASEYKVKRLTHSFHESWWVRMTVHKDCWRELCKSIAEKKEKN